MKKLYVLPLLALLVAAIPTDRTPDVADTAPAAVAEAGGGQIGICHFPGHDGDFVLSGRGGGCINRGGNVIIVGRMACEKGHGADGQAPTGWLCSDDNEDRVRNGPYYRGG